MPSFEAPSDAARRSTRQVTSSSRGIDGRWVAAASRHAGSCATKVVARRDRRRASRSRGRTASTSRAVHDGAERASTNFTAATVARKA